MPGKEKDTIFTDSEEKDELTLYEWLVDKIDEMFIENIPLDSIKELPTTFMYSLGCASYTLSLFCLIWFIRSGNNYIIESCNIN
jgi:hypothetical protein